MVFHLDVHNALVEIFKDSGADVSLSLSVNKCLKELSELLRRVDKEIKESKEYAVPMSFIIKSIVESKDILMVGKDWPDELPEKLEFMLLDWQEDYDAQQRKIPVEFYRYLTSGLYILSPNKKYLIEKKTGKRYIPIDKNRLVPLDDNK